MLFSSLLFLWYFLPSVLLLTLLSKNLKVTNFILLIFSLIFYGWGEPKYIGLMLVSVLLNYVSGIIISKNGKQVKKAALVICVMLNLLLLGYFKYFNFVIEILNFSVGQDLIAAKNIALPVGISFYTFQAMSYVIDLYRDETDVQKNYFNLLLYVSFFPQLIAGPIVRYKDIEEMLNYRKVELSGFALGVKRFVIGLAKKVILANTFAQTVDYVWGLGFNNIGTSITWIVVILYALQIYYDFCGYSDMAIGLGKMFGFDFLENFSFPYISKSIQEFWRRWHISLSTWFKEYLYIPLGGSRKGTLITYRNLLIVFFCTGLWHGASVNFIIWGLWHGMFLIFERLFLSKILSKDKTAIFSRIYTLLVVLIGWVFFRAETFSEITAVLSNMFIFKEGYYGITELVNLKTIVFLFIGVFAGGVFQSIPLFKNTKKGDISIADILAMVVMLIICIALLISNAYNPFIYYRF